MLSNWRSRHGLLTRAAGYVVERSVGLVLAAVVGIFVARHLGPEGLGLLNYAGSVFALLAPLVLLGMQEILVREFSTKAEWRVVLASALARQIPVAVLVSAVGFVVVAATRGFDREAVLIAIALVPLPVLSVGITLRSYLEAEGRVRRIVVTGIVAGLVAAIFKVTGIMTDAPVWFFALAMTVEAAVVAVGLIGGVGRKGALRDMWSFADRKVGRSLVRESWPLLLSGIAVLLYMRADIVMLGILTDDQETGIYVAAARLSEVWYFLPVSALAAVRPRLARLFAEGNHSAYRTLIQQFMTVAFAVSVVVAVIVLLLSDRLVVSVYGSAFTATAGVLRVHIFAAPFVFLGTAASQWFIDRNLTRAVLIRSLIGAATNIVLNLVLIPPFGATGAAIATLVSYSVGVLYNAVPRDTREVFGMQMRAVRLAWR